MTNGSLRHGSFPGGIDPAVQISDWQLTPFLRPLFVDLWAENATLSHATWRKESCRSGDEPTSWEDVTYQVAYYIISYIYIHLHGLEQSNFKEGHWWTFRSVKGALRRKDIAQFFPVNIPYGTQFAYSINQTKNIMGWNAVCFFLSC